MPVKHATKIACRMRRRGGVPAERRVRKRRKACARLQRCFACFVFMMLELRDAFHAAACFYFYAASSYETFHAHGPCLLL